MKHLRLFQTETDYAAYKVSSDYILPNVCLAKDLKQLHYSENPFIEKTRISNDGQAYILTDYYVSNYDVMEFYYDVEASDKAVLGSKGSNFWVALLQTRTDKSYKAWDTTSSVFDVSYADKDTKFGMVIENGVYNAKFIQTDASVDKILTSYDEPPIERICDVPLCLFTRSLEDGTADMEKISRAILGPIIIKDSRTGRVKLQLTPGIVGGEVGMYDKVTGKFYTNSNTSGTLSVQ